MIRTEKGDMMAFNLSSLSQLKEAGGQTSRKLHNVASMFGAAVSLLCLTFMAIVINLKKNFVLKVLIFGYIQLF